MTDLLHATGPKYTTFNGHNRLASGSLLTNALALKRAQGDGALGPLLIFDNSTGRCVDVDTRGSEDDIAARLTANHPPATAAEGVVTVSPTTEPRGRGRPKLGVVSREVTLLPRHWDWLAAQPGGASVAMRKLVEDARKTGHIRQQARQAQEAAYHFMSAMAGDLPGFEEASRALFAHNESRFKELTAAWPQDIRHHVITLAFGQPTLASDQKAP